jgi:hypothetical protein
MKFSKNGRSRDYPSPSYMGPILIPRYGRRGIGHEYLLIIYIPDKKMTTDALFAAASTTKAFTSAATSMVIKDSNDTDSPIDWGTRSHL